MSKDFSNEIVKATKWSFATELLSKMIAPISAMILARLLTPEAYGIVATITIITSFSEIFADAGFQKYMVQHEFETKEEKYKCANVAFWTNIFISGFILLLIAVFRHKLAILVGSKGLGNTLAIAAISVPLVSISSLQMALFRREFDYKTLFQTRICTLIVPFVITIPIAFVTKSYWALIIGTIAINLTNTVLLYTKSVWKPKFEFDVKWFKEMFSFSIWTLLEQISIWCSSNIDLFIVGTVLSSYYLGLYKTSMSMSSLILTIITGATTSILFSALSRLQNDFDKFKVTFFKFQRIVAMLIMPMGVGIYIYRELVTVILLGEQWIQAADFIGWYSLLGGFSIVLSHYCSEIYRSLGKPKLSFIVQIIFILGLIPVIYFSAHQSFETLAFSRSLMRLYMVVVHSIFIWFVLRLSIFQFIQNVMPSIICSILMGIFGVLVNSLIDSFWWNLLCVGLCIIFYFVCISILFPQLKNEGIGFLKGNRK